MAIVGGDKYTYGVVFDVKGGQDIIREAKALGRFQQAMAETSVAADRMTASSGRAARASHQLGVANGKMGGASQRAAQSMMTMTYVMDDMQYGTRGLMNNIPMITTSLLGFGVAGAAAGAVGTILAGVFREDIDAALAWAGVLDENVVKGMEKGKKGTEDFANSLAQLREEYQEFDKATRDVAAGVITAFEDAGKEAEDKLAASMVRDLIPGFDTRRQRLLDEIKAAEEQLGNAWDDALLGIFGGETKSSRLKGLQKDLEDLDKAGSGHLEKIRKEAVRSDDALRKLAQAAWDSGEQGLAKSLLAATKEGKALAEQLEKVKEATEVAVRADEIAVEALRGRVDETNDLDTAIWRMAKAAEAAYAAAERGDKKAAERAAAESERHANRVQQIRDEVKATEEAERKKLEIQMAAIDAARKQAEAADRDEMVNRTLAALGGRFDASISNALQQRTMAGQGLGSVGVGGSTDDVATQVMQRLVRSGVGADAAQATARKLVEDQAMAIQSIVDANNLNHQLNRHASGQMDRLRLIMEAERARTMQLIQAGARRSLGTRSNGLGTFRPF